MQKLTVTGMTCGGCAKSVEKAVTKAAPDASPSVDLASAILTFADSADRKAVIQAVEKAGFGVAGA